MGENVGQTLGALPSKLGGVGPVRRFCGEGESKAKPSLCHSLLSVWEITRRKIFPFNWIVNSVFLALMWVNGTAMSMQQ